MNVNWKLWPLAFVAALATGCSDDLEGGSGKGENELTGPATYMTVSINSELTTRSAEDGDGAEEGIEKEYDVKNVTVVLYTDENGDGSAAPTSFTAKSKLIGAGFASINGSSESSEPGHSREATVTVKITDPTVEFDGKTYGVVAVTNLTNAAELANRVKSDDIDTGAELADFLQKGYETSSVGFVMSSHLPKAETVTLEAGATEADAPVANVHVERLAAKIRVKEANTGVLPSFFYQVTDNEEAEVAKARLDQVAIVNQLNSGSYLLKRVSATTSDAVDIPAVASDVYLGDEAYTDFNTANYVIDPWTRNKTSQNVSAISGITGTDGSTALSYAQPLVDENKNYETVFNGFATKYTLAANDALTDTPDEKIDLGYTLENTMAADASLVGYMTGALYKATYFPKVWMVAKTDNTGVEKGIPQFGEGGNIAYDNVDKTTKGVTFYSYQGVIYKDFPAIFIGEYWSFLQEEGGITYADFTDNIASLSKDKFMKSHIAQAPDPLGYLAYLKENAGVAGEDGNWTGNFTAEDSFTKYYEDNFEINKTALLAHVRRYVDGINYYPYWIRHEDNDDKTTTGIMEYGIVRNNIYDMTVTGISGLGKSGDETPDPENPGETDDLLFTVNLYVKDWIIRSNDGIIL